MFFVILIDQIDTLLTDVLTGQEITTILVVEARGASPSVVTLGSSVASLAAQVAVVASCWLTSLLDGAAMASVLDITKLSDHSVHVLATWLSCESLELASWGQVALSEGRSLVIDVLLAHDTAVSDSVLSVVVWLQLVDGKHNSVGLILVVVDLVLHVVHLAASAHLNLLLLVVVAVDLLNLILLVVTAPDLVVLMEVDHVSLSLGQVAVISELAHTELLDDLEDVELLVEHLLTLSKELVLSPWVLPAAETPWVAEVLQDEQSPGTVGEWTTVSEFTLERIHVLAELWLDHLVATGIDGCGFSI